MSLLGRLTALVRQVVLVLFLLVLFSVLFPFFVLGEGGFDKSSGLTRGVAVSRFGRISAYLPGPR